MKKAGMNVIKINHIITENIKLFKLDFLISLERYTVFFIRNMSMRT